MGIARGLLLHNKNTGRRKSGAQYLRVEKEKRVWVYPGKKRPQPKKPRQATTPVKISTTTR